MTMLSLDDEEDLIAERLIGSVEPEPRRRVNLRPLLMGLLVLILGGGLGGGAYVLSNMDTRDIIALLDIGDQPRLALDMPGRGGAKPEPPPPAAIGAGPLLTPPGSVMPGKDGAPSLTQPAPAAGEAHSVAPMPMTPPLKPEAPKPEIAAAPVLPPPPPVIAPPPIPAAAIPPVPAPA